jgi:hypothetical protein
MRDDSGMPTSDAEHGATLRSRILDAYFRTAGSPDLDTIRSAVWRIAPTATADMSEADRSVVLEQYKLYVEMADRVSSRRGLANTFFLTLNTAIVAGVAAVLQHPPHHLRGLLAVPLVGLLAQCLSWFWTLRSYRQLNSAKFAVVGALEERLPASPYWSAEWAALGFGRDPARYWPLSHVESWIPALFAVAYTAAFVAILLS